jgi:hypothetical protein
MIHITGVASVDDLRAQLVSAIEKHTDAVRFHQGQLASAEAALAAHDAAVEAMRAATAPAENADATRAHRRNLADEVYTRLDDEPQTLDELVAAIDGTRSGQIAAAILKLGEKVVFKDGGYVRREGDC